MVLGELAPEHLMLLMQQRVESGGERSRVGSLLVLRHLINSAGIVLLLFIHSASYSNCIHSRKQRLSILSIGVMRVGILTNSLTPHNVFTTNFGVDLRLHYLSIGHRTCSCTCMSGVPGHSIVTLL